MRPPEASSGPGSPSVRPFASHEWRIYRDLRLRALADSPDAFGSTLAREAGGADEKWAARLARGVASGTDCPLVAEVNGCAVGLTWARVDAPGDTEAHLFQMRVAPGCRGRGAGRLLLRAAIDWALSANVRALHLAVTWGDTPAMRLYRRAGFEPVGDPAPLRPGSPLLARSMRLELPPLR